MAYEPLGVCPPVRVELIAVGLTRAEVAAKLRHVADSLERGAVEGVGQGRLYWKVEEREG